MSQFNLEQELQSATRLDSSINVRPTGRSSSRPKPLASLKRADSGTSKLSTSSILAAHNGGLNRSSSGALNRSRSESRLAASLLSAVPAARSKTPTRVSNSLVDLNKTPTHSSDRFIPNRSTTDFEMAQHSLSRSRDDLTSSGSSNDTNGVNSVTEQLRRQTMRDILHSDEAGNGNHNASRILSYRSKAPAPSEGHANNLKVLYSTGKPRLPNAAKTRQVAAHPEKILDAPDLEDDFYLHLLDWSSNNHLAVALSTSLFIWNANDGTIDDLFTREEDDDTICSLRWVKEGNIIATSDKEGTVELWDVTDKKLLRRMEGHSDRVATLDWNEYILASGCRDGKVFFHDVRVPEHLVQRLNGHTQV